MSHALFLNKQWSVDESTDGTIMHVTRWPGCIAHKMWLSKTVCACYDQYGTLLGITIEKETEVNMGYYIEVPDKHNKAQQIIDLYGAVKLPPPDDLVAYWTGIPEGKALVCVMQNGPFDAADAAGYAFDYREFFRFAIPDGREKTWLLMDEKQVRELTRFNSK